MTELNSSNKFRVKSSSDATGLCADGNLTLGERYRYSVMVRIADDDTHTSAPLNICLFTDTTQSIASKEATFTVTKSGWTKLYIDVTLSTEKYTTFAVNYLQEDGKTLSIIADDFKIEKGLHFLSADETKVYNAIDEDVKTIKAEYFDEGDYVIAVDIVNDGVHEDDVSIIAAGYKDDVLTSVKLTDKTVPSGYSEQVLPINVTSENAFDYIKVYVWNKETAFPASASYTMEKKPSSPTLPKVEYSDDEVELPDGTHILKETSLFTTSYASENFDGFSSQASYTETATYNITDYDIVTFEQDTISDLSLPFSHILCATVSQLPEGAGIGSSVTMKPATVGISKGDNVLISFWARVTDSSADDGSGSFMLKFQNGAPDYDHSINTSVYLTPEWNKYYVPFEAKYDHTVGECALSLRFSQAIQTIEIGGLSMVNYADDVAINDMPKTRYEYYKGIEEDAEWREEAEKRIEAYRKGDITVIVKDADGNAVEDASVSVDMLSHEFDFGGTIWDDPSYYKIDEEGQKLADKYNDAFFDAVKENFNTVVIGNNLKWPRWEAYRQRALDTAVWAKENGLKLRGHNLIWDSPTHMPDDIWDIVDNEEEVIERMKAHITDIVSATKDYVYEWDVVNEPVLNYYFLNKYGYDTFVNYFNWARAANPGAKLYVNDASVLGVNSRKYDKLKEILTEMENYEVDYDAIGLESHFSAPCSITLFYNQLEELAKFGKEIKITEYSMNADDDIKAHFTKDFLTICFSHPSVNGFIMWTWWSGTEVNTKSAMYNEGTTLNPAGEQILDLIYNKWWTNNQGKTGSNGKYTSRGFYGDYLITVSKDGVSSQKQIKVESGDTNNIVMVIGE